MHLLNLINTDTNYLMIKIFSRVLKNENETEIIAKQIGKILKLGDVILLNGNLGVGKTFFSKNIINSIFGDVEVTSPTFNLVKIYENSSLTKLSLWHCDFFRLNDSTECYELGVFDEIEKKIVLIEWPEIAQRYYRFDELFIHLEYKINSVHRRILNIFGSKKWESRLNFLIKQ